MTRKESISLVKIIYLRLHFLVIQSRFSQSSQSSFKKIKRKKTALTKTTITRPLPLTFNWATALWNLESVSNGAVNLLKPRMLFFFCSQHWLERNDACCDVWLVPMRIHWSGFKEWGNSGQPLKKVANDELNDEFHSRVGNSFHNCQRPYTMAL